MNQKTRNAGQWTEARFNSFVKSALRAASQKWPPRYSVLNKACVGQKVNKSTGRLAKHYVCAACEYEFPGKEIQVNHIISVVPVSGFDSWDGVIERLFCEEPGLEVLCIPCHKERTKQENDERKQF